MRDWNEYPNFRFIYGSHSSSRTPVGIPWYVSDTVPSGPDSGRLCQGILNESIVSYMTSTEPCDIRSIIAVGYWDREGGKAGLDLRDGKEFRVEWWYMYHLVVRTRGHEELFVDVRQSAVKDKGNFKRHRDWMEGVHSWCRESATGNFFKCENVRNAIKVAFFTKSLQAI